MSLDSRVLTHLSCYGQRFTMPGTVRYRLLVGPGACPPGDEGQFTIEVAGKAAGQEGGQHEVEVRFRDGVLSADPSRLEIRPGDLVLWHAANAAVPGFTVRGEGPGARFDSSSLAEQAVYTHAFGVAGRYEWVDARGGPVQGVVEVVAPERTEPADCEAWIKALAEGALILVTKGVARPERVRVHPGQTVFWAVESAPGITITDRRLIG